MRKAYAIYYGGLQVKEQLKPQLDAYARWRHQLMATHRGQMPSDLEKRNTEATLLTAIAAAALAIGRAGEMHQRQHWALDDDAALTSDEVPTIERELCDQRLRDGRFPHRLGLWCAQLVRDHVYLMPGNQDLHAVGLSDDAVAQLSSLIEGVAR